MPESIILSVKDVANKLKMTEQNVRNLVRKGDIIATRVGKQWIVTEKDLDCYIKRKNYIPDPDDYPRKSSDIPPFVALSFFSGAMGLDLGMEQAGIRALLACEFEKNCRRTIHANRPDMALIGDIRKYGPEEIRKMARIEKDTEIDLIYGGPPCQAFSTAGNRKGFNDDRGNVFLTFINLVLQLKPRYVAIENVRGLLSAPYFIDESIDSKPRKGGALLYIINKLNENGYATSFNLYNAANFGAPQIRERVVIIGSRDGKKPPYLTPTNSDNSSYGLPAWKTLGQALKGLDEDCQHYVQFPEDRLKYYRMLNQGQYWKNLPPDVQKEAMGRSYDLPGGKTGFYRRLSFDKPSPTLVTIPTMPATDLCHPVEDRPLSIEEYRRIQGFPDDWIICGNIIDQYKQIGNAVPVSLGKAIGLTIINGSKNIPPESFPGFKYSRYNNTDDCTWIKSMFPDLIKKNLPPCQTTLDV